MISESRVQKPGLRAAASALHTPGLGMRSDGAGGWSRISRPGPVFLKGSQEEGSNSARPFDSLIPPRGPGARERTQRKEKSSKSRNIYSRRSSPPTGPHLPRVRSSLGNPAAAINGIFRSQ